jgi:hypothetical protein
LASYEMVEGIDFFFRAWAEPYFPVRRDDMGVTGYPYLSKRRDLAANELLCFCRQEFRHKYIETHSSRIAFLSADDDYPSSTIVARIYSAVKDWRQRESKRGCFGTRRCSYQLLLSSQTVGEDH